MNYILCNIGNIPKHLLICINNILSVDNNAKIFLISDNNLDSKYITNINFNDFEDLLDLKKEFFEYYKNTGFSSVKYPVFYTSLLRVFMLQKASLSQNLKSFVHFDNDVSIYLPFDKIKKNFDDSKINITKVSNKDLVFGYSYFPDPELLSDLTLRIRKTMSKKFYSNQYYRGGPLNEMRILGIINKLENNIFNILPSLPYFTENKTLFDPSSYGQFLNGLHLKRGNYIFKRSHVLPTEIVGSEIKSKRIRVKFKNNLPLVVYNQESYKLANLHIHSKNLKKYLPSNYQDYISLS